MADERDRQSSGNSRALVPAYTLTYGAGAGQSWFGPLAPMRPVAPTAVKGRIFDFPTGYNQSIRPRAYEPISFEQLRAFADGYDLLRLVIETRKDQLAKMHWDLAPREFAKDKAEQLAGRITEIKKFFVRPDKHHFWAEWLRMLLEDLFVLDAPTVHRRKTNGGDPFSFDPLDGATIKRILDENARTPEPPKAAYQQVLKGLPAVEYTTEELIYRPRNPRTHKVYGYSPVEQIIMTINIALRRQVWQLQSFTEGNMPEALIGVPMTWTPDQIEKFQDWFDQMLEGNTAQRRKAKFIPGDVAKGYMATKPAAIFEAETEEWLARVVCFCFSISPAPFVKMMNRATGESIQEAALEEGLAPIMGWVKAMMDTIIIEDFEEEELEFVWKEEDELDQNVQSQIIDRDVGNGVQTLNDGRRAKGLDPYNHPDADRPMVKTATGYTFVLLTPEEQAAKDALAAAATLAPPGGAAGEDDTSPGQGDGKGPGKTPPKKTDPGKVQKADWNEEDHPRGENGRFGEGGGGPQVTTDHEADYASARADYAAGGTTTHEQVMAALDRRNAEHTFQNIKEQYDKGHATHDRLTSARDERDAAHQTYLQAVSGRVAKKGATPFPDDHCARCAEDRDGAALSKGEWSEEDHPRAENGQFGEGGGSLIASTESIEAFMDSPRVSEDEDWLPGKPGTGYVADEKGEYVANPIPQAPESSMWAFDEIANDETNGGATSKEVMQAFGYYTTLTPEEIRTTQNTLNPDKVKEYYDRGIGKKGKGDDWMPFVIQTDGVKSLADGNHRVAAALIRGESKVSVHLLKFDQLKSFTEKYMASRGLKGDWQNHAKPAAQFKLSNPGKKP